MLKLTKKYPVVVICFLVFIIWTLSVVILSSKLNLISGEAEHSIDENLYQAVFLSNDQIYFGHLKNLNSQFFLLSNVYYVMIGGSDLPGGGNRLVRLGQNEAHGPLDHMVINKDHVLFLENLTPDSPVVQAIRNLQSQR